MKNARTKTAPVTVIGTMTMTKTEVSPEHKSRLRISDSFHMYFINPAPGLWHRFWQRVLLGWEWDDL